MMDWRTRIYDAYVSSGSSRLSQNDVDDTLRRKARNLDLLCERYVPPDRDAHIVDFGCGFGALLGVLKRRGYCNVEGIDVSPEMVLVAQTIGIPEVRLGTISEFFDGCPDSSLDVAVFMDVLGHLTRGELLETLDHVVRVLRPGGRLIAHVPNGQGIFGATIRYGDLTHEIAFTPQSMRQALLTVGFKDIQCYEDEIVVHGVVSAARKAIWSLGTVPVRVLYAAETGNKNIVLTSNMLVVADRA